MREQAWKEVCQVTGGKFDVNECKAKWGNIKTAYQKVRAKMHSTKSGQAAVKKTPHWPYWNAMQFLHRKESTVNTTSESNHSLPGAAINDEVESTMSVIESGPESESPCLSATNDGRAKRKRKMRNAPSTVTSLTSRTMERALEIMEKTNDDDEWQIIGNYLAGQLRSLAVHSLEKAQRIHRKITRLVLDAWDEEDLNQVCC